MKYLRRNSQTTYIQMAFCSDVRHANGIATKLVKVCFLLSSQIESSRAHKSANEPATTTASVWSRYGWNVYSKLRQRHTKIEWICVVVFVSFIKIHFSFNLKSFHNMISNYCQLLWNHVHCCRLCAFNCKRIFASIVSVWARYCFFLLRCRFAVAKMRC